MHKVTEMTKEQKVEMYRRLKKDQLIEMLIEANNLLSHISKPTFIPYDPNVPTVIPPYTVTCSTGASN